MNPDDLEKIMNTQNANNASSSLPKKTTGLLSPDQLSALMNQPINQQQELTQYPKGSLKQEIIGGLLSGTTKAFEDVPFSKYLVPYSQPIINLSNKVTSLTPSNITQSPAFSRAQDISRYGIDVAQLARPTYELGKLGAKGVAGAYDVIKDLVGGKSVEKSTNFIENLLGKAEPGKAHVAISDAVRGLNSNAVENNSKLYGDFLDAADSRGYVSNVPGVKALQKNELDKISKTGVYSDEMQNILSNAYERLGAKGASSVESPRLAINPVKMNNILRGSSQNVLNALNTSKFRNLMSDFSKNPSLPFAHELQNYIRTEGIKLQRTADPITKNIGNEVYKVGNGLLNDIKDTLTKNGDSDLIPLYEKASDDYVENVVPFKSSNIIQKAIGKPGQTLKRNPKGIINELLGDDEGASKIRDLLPNEDKNILLASKFQNEMKYLPGKGRFADPLAIIKDYANLEGQGLSSLRTPDSENGIQDVMRSVNRSKLAKRGIAGLIGYLGVHSLL